MNIYSIPPLISLVLFLTIGVFVLLKNKKSLGITFFLFSFLSFWWQFNWFILFNINNEEIASFLIRFGYTGIILLPLIFARLLLLFAKCKNYSKLHYIIALFFIVSNWTTNYFLEGFYHYFFGFYPKAGFLHLIYLIWLTYLLLTSLYKLYISVYRDKNVSVTEKNQLKFVLFGSFFYTMAASDFIVNYGVLFYLIGFVCIIIGLTLYAYAIVKHRLMDINLA